jgi:RNA polymerase sigma factor (sigma-70 family)
VATPSHDLIYYLRSLLHHHRDATESDRELLRRFVERCDDDAFTTLLRRHGPMVLNLARRITGDQQLAEDVFQATFLLLSRKAGTIRRPEALPCWLHGVARRLAVQTRSTQLRCQRQRTRRRPSLSSTLLDELTAQEFLTVLDEELAKLPDNYRAPLILCCLEGLAQEEAAKRLGCSAGALRGRLERGRRRLRLRLEKRGLTLPAVFGGTLLVAGATSPVPAALAQSTLQVATTGGSPSAAVAALTEEAMRMMFANKFKAIGAAVLLLAVTGTGVSMMALRPQTAKESAPQVTADDKPLSAKKTVDLYGDPLPEGAVMRLGTVRWRAGACIYAAAISPDDKLLATACESGITFFDVETGKPRHLRESLVPIRYDADPIGSRLAFSPDGKKLVNITRWGNLRFWDVAAGKLLRVVGNGDEPTRGAMQIGPFPPPVSAPPGKYKFFTKVWFTRGKPSVVACNHDNYVAFVDPSSGKTDLRFRTAGKLASVASDGKTLAALDPNNPEVILYDDKGKELRRFRHGNKIELGTTLCLGGKRLVTVNEKAEIRIWDAGSGKVLRTIAVPATNDDEWKPSVVSIVPDGNTLFAGTHGGDILRWDLRDGKEQSPLRGHVSGFVTGLFHTNEGRSLVSVSWDQMVHRWDLTTGKAARVGEGYSGSVIVARSPDGRNIATASYPDRLEFWDARTGTRLRAFSLPVRRFQILRFSPDGKQLALACSDARVRLWDVESERVTRELKMPPSRQPADRGESYFEGLAWSRDGRFLVASLQSGGIRLWEATSGKEIWHGARRGIVAFSTDGQTIVSGSWDKRLTWQDAATGRERFVREVKQGDAIRSIAFSPDGQYLATSQSPGFHLRDPKTGEVRKTLPSQDLVWSISFSPDSKWLASGGYDGTVRIWEVATGAEVLSRKGHEGWVLQVEFGPEGRSVLSSSLDLTALLWDLRPSSEPGRERNLEALWSDLAGEPVKAYRAIWELVGDARSASALLRKKLAPVKIDVDEWRLRALLADLDSDDVATRESASRALTAMGAAVEIPLRRALADSPSAEVQRRLLSLLDALKREPTPEEHRLMRAVQVMELCATAEARNVLRQWAGGAAGAPLTEQSKAALKRSAR